MDNKTLVVQSNQLKYSVVLLLVLALASGFWLATLFTGLSSVETIWQLISWARLGLGIILVICCWLLARYYSKSWRGWQQTVVEMMAENKQLKHEIKSKSKETENQKTRVFATCRHTRLKSVLKELHSLMTSHLENVTAETNDAALNLINQLTHIHEAVSLLLNTLSSNQEQSDQIIAGSQSTLENNQETMKRLQNYIDHRLQEVEYDHQMALDLQKQAAIMSDLTNMIDLVAKQTTIIATNAKIESTRAGVFGKAFGIIADEVTNLSAQIGDASKQIIRSIDQMKSGIEEKFKAKLDITAKSEERGLLSSFKDQLVQLGNSYIQLKQFSDETLNNINISSKEIKSKVNESLTAIQFQDMTQQQIEVILKSLHLFEHYLSEQTCFEILSNKGADFDEFDLDQIRNLYVMKKQRDIHARHRQEKQMDGYEQEETDSENISLF